MATKLPPGAETEKFENPPAVEAEEIAAAVVASIQPVAVAPPDETKVTVELTAGELAVVEAERAARRAAILKPAVPANLLVKMYRVNVDGIVAGDDKQALGIGVLTGIISRADIENSGADFDWLLSSGAIEEAGYR